MTTPPQTFETPRLLARPPQVSDAPEVFASYAGDPAVTRFLSWRAHANVKSVEEFLARGEEAWRTGQGHFPWLLRRRDSGEVAGSIGLSVAGPSVVFGYCLGRKHWGQGLAPEALKWLVDWALSQPAIFRAWAYCDVENPVSARVMEKAGMQREGILRRWHTCPNIGPEPRDCIVCSKVR
jgi:RimJ/RimL family protein N-acetyltransferase